MVSPKPEELVGEEIVDTEREERLQVEDAAAIGHAKGDVLLVVTDGNDVTRSIHYLKVVLVVGHRYHLAEESPTANTELTVNPWTATE